MFNAILKKVYAKSETTTDTTKVPESPRIQEVETPRVVEKKLILDTKTQVIASSLWSRLETAAIIGTSAIGWGFYGFIGRIPQDMKLALASTALGGVCVYKGLGKVYDLGRDILVDKKMTGKQRFQMGINGFGLTAGGVGFIITGGLLAESIVRQRVSEVTCPTCPEQIKCPEVKDVNVLASNATAITTLPDNVAEDHL